MTRTTRGFDRMAVLATGLGLVAAGLWVAGWQLGRFSADDQVLDAGTAARWPEQAWWPAALAVAGTVLALFALRWLLAHRPVRRLPAVSLDGTDETGRLRADLSAVARAAATGLAADLAIRSARGRAVEDRGRRTIEVLAVIDPASRLTAVEQAATAVAGQVGAMAGPGVAVRIRLRSARP